MTGTSCPVLVIDDHELVSATVTLGLRSRGYDARPCRIVSMAQILADAAAIPPGVALLDLDLGRDADGCRLDGADLVADLSADGWRVLVVTGLDDQTRLAAAVTAGAVGIMSKTGSLNHLSELIDRAADGQTVIPSQERREWAEEHRAARRLASRMSLLTSRERQILDDIVAGRRAGEIAATHGVSVTTIRSHIRAVLIKLEVKSQLEAAALVRGRRD